LEQIKITMRIMIRTLLMVDAPRFFAKLRASHD
jgi:hypothetical protein